MRSIKSILFPFLRDILGRNILIMLGFYSFFSTFMPLLLIFLFSESGDVQSNSDLMFAMAIYLGVSVGIYAVQYTRMQLSLGITRKSLWIVQVLIGSLVLAVAGCLIAFIGNHVIAGIANGTARLFALDARFDVNPFYNQFIFASTPEWQRLLFFASGFFLLMAAVQFGVYYIQRWKLQSFAIGSLLVVFFVWMLFFRLDLVAKAAKFLFAGGGFITMGKMMLNALILMGLSFIPMRRLEMK